MVGIRDRWRVDDRWWTEEPVSRMYWELELKSGEVLTLFQDLLGSAWYQQRHTVALASPALEPLAPDQGWHV